MRPVVGPSVEELFDISVGELFQANESFGMCKGRANLRRRRADGRRWVRVESKNPAWWRRG
jgi:hypothetical protein